MPAPCSFPGRGLAKSQGLRTVAAIRDELAAGRLPAARLLDGAMILAGGILCSRPDSLPISLGSFSSPR